MSGKKWVSRSLTCLRVIQILLSYFLDIDPCDWDKMKIDNNWNEVQMRDNRYNQVIHMVSAAEGAEAFYTVAGHQTRHESLIQAIELDKITAGVSIMFKVFNFTNHRPKGTISKQYLCLNAWIHV